MESILVAGDPDSRDFVNDAYGDLASVTFASSVAEVQDILERSPPTILIGTLAFDESRFLSLIPQALALKVKVVVVECPTTLLDLEIIDSARFYAEDAGIAAWWDMRTTLAQKGIAAAAKEIRGIILAILRTGTVISNP